MTFDVTPLSPSETALRNEVRAFLDQERANGLEIGLGLNASASVEFSRAVARRGWLAMNVPVEYGGQGRPFVDRFIVAEEMLAAGAPIGAHWVGDRQTAPMLVRYGTESQKSRFLPAIVRGEVWFCLGMSEPDSGSDLASVRTRAVRVPGGFRVTGQKVWTTGAHFADYIVTLCRTSPTSSDGLGTSTKHAGLSQLIIDLRADGVKVSPIRMLNGAHHFNEIHFDDVFVPDEMVLGVVGEGWRQVTAELAHERSGPDRYLSVMPVIAAVYDLVLGSEQIAPEARRSFGQLFAAIMNLRTIALGVARSFDAGQVRSTESALIKELGTRFETAAVQVLREVVDRELDADSVGLDRLLADAVVTSPTFTLRGGTNEVLRTIIARDLLGTTARRAG